MALAMDHQFPFPFPMCQLLEVMQVISIRQHKYREMHKVVDIFVRTTKNLLPLQHLELKLFLPRPMYRVARSRQLVSIKGQTFNDKSQ